MKVMGLDVSSARTGVTIVERIDANNVKRLFMCHIDMTKCDGMWEKVDVVRDWFQERWEKDDELSNHMGEVELIGIEEACLGFSGGATSSNTLTVLIRMNVLTSYIVRELFEITPIFVPAATARKACGIKTQQVKKCGVSVKQQVFNYMIAEDLKDMVGVWPLKKQTKASIAKGKPPQYRDFCYDETDSFVVAKSVSRLHGA